MICSPAAGMCGAAVRVDVAGRQYLRDEPGRDAQRRCSIHGGKCAGPRKPASLGPHCAALRPHPVRAYPLKPYPNLNSMLQNLLYLGRTAGSTSL